MVAPSMPYSAQADAAASSSRVAVSWPSEFGGRPRLAGRGGDFEDAIALIMNARSFNFNLEMGALLDLSVRENLELGGFIVGSDLDARIERELARFPQLGRRLGSQAGSLSGGEQQQLAVAKALVVDPRVLCIDELSLGLAPTVVA